MKPNKKHELITLKENENLNHIFWKEICKFNKASSYFKNEQ